MITANFKSPKHTLLGICVRLIVFEAVLIIFEAVLLQFLCAVFFHKMHICNSKVWFELKFAIVAQIPDTFAPFSSF
jgi:hypothetical protein